MEMYMKFSKLFLCLSSLFLFSCNGTLIYEEFELQPQTEAWIVQEEKNHSFEMKDENGITTHWQLTEEYKYYNETKGFFLFIPTDKTNVEKYYQTYTSSVLGDFGINVDAGFSDANPSVSLDTPTVEITFDALTYKPLTFHLLLTNGDWFSWYAGDGDDVPFEFKIVTDYEINGAVFPEEVAVFELTKRQNEVDPISITNFSYSKELGLIYLELNNGLKYYRI